MTEGRSTGIPKIIKALKNNNSPKPKFKFDNDYSYFEVIISVNKEVLEFEKSKQKTITPQDTPQDTPQVIELIKVLKGEMSRNEIMAELKLKDREYFRKKYLNPAIENGLVEPTIPDKPNSKYQKYRLTKS